MADIRLQRNYQNLQKAMFEGVGQYGIPELLPTYELPQVENWVEFSGAAQVTTPYCYGVHFFIDDYRFERTWAKPDEYVDRLRRFSVVLSPDFSIYTDFPKAIQVYNHYRKHWLAAYWQYNGLTVIPTITWGGLDSYDFCFDGEPKNSIVAVSAIGSQRTKETADLFISGYVEMKKRLTPKQIIVYGTAPDVCIGDDIIEVKSYAQKWAQKRRF